MERGLESFACRIEIGPGIFVLTGVLVLLVAFLTVSYQSIKAALADPVTSLRYEFADRNAEPFPGAIVYTNVY